MSTYWLPITALGFAVFVILNWIAETGPSRSEQKSIEDRVVISAPVQLLLYAGDRFLAANYETIRLAATTTSTDDRNTAIYLNRAHALVAQLNPCHEDNYYLGNALLTWGGMESQGSDLLKHAAECRFWDEFPPFFYGFNQYFFHRNIDEASKAFELAAERSSQNAAVLRNLSIIIKTEQMEDETMAVNYLREEISKADDPKLKQMLNKRLVRLQGLITLRQAQSVYEKKIKQPLKHPQQLIDQGILEKFPEDPLRLGYEFADGKFRLRQRKVQGMENRQ